MLSFRPVISVGFSFVFFVFACGPVHQNEANTIPDVPTVTGVVCDGYYEASDDNAGKSFGFRDMPGSCSWYCNSNVTVFTYSSEAAIPNDKAAIAQNEARLFDYKTDTAFVMPRPVSRSIDWQVGLGPSTYGSEKYSRLDAEGIQQTRFNGFVLVNGNVSSALAYRQYARLKSGRLFVNDTCVALLRLGDTPKAQLIRLPRSYPLDTLHRSHVRLQITEIYPGEKHGELAVAEMQLDGFGGHSLTRENCGSQK